MINTNEKKAKLSMETEANVIFKLRAF